MHRALPLTLQSFAGNPLVRGIGARRLEQLLNHVPGAAEPQFALVANNKLAVVVGSAAGTTAVQLQWLDRSSLASLNLLYTGAGEHLSLGDKQAPIYFLGEDRQRRVVQLAVDVAAAPPGWAEQHSIRLQDLRVLMPLLKPAELAVAGHAMALSQWHQAHLFCSRCGSPSVSVDGGARRQCSGDESHRQYPRTDPVVIMLVESPDGNAALLGRSKKMRAGMLTCLSGFVDQGEGIEEAVARETREEAGIRVSAVDIVGSQPWPVGRGGSCELMIGCIAQAAAVEITMDPEEMEEVRWFSKADVAEAVAASISPASPYYQGAKGPRPPPASSASSPAFFVPPPIAIAHHLLRQWAAHHGPWFPQQQQEEAEKQEDGAAAAGAGLEQATALSNL